MSFSYFQFSVNLFCNALVLFYYYLGLTYFYFSFSSVQILFYLFTANFNKKMLLPRPFILKFCNLIFYFSFMILLFF